MKQVTSILSVIFLTLLLIGCGSESKSSVAKVDTNVDLSLSALYAGKSSRSRATKILTGELQAFNVTTGTTEIYTWSAYLNDASLSVTSNKTIALTPGDYSFSLLLNDGTNQYAGTSVLEVVADATQNTIAMNVAPIIGDTVANVSVIANLATYKLSYLANELTGLTNPQVGVSANGAAETIFTINKTTGLSETYLNLTDGVYNIHMSFYDGNIQVGRSVPAQENVTITAGTPLSIDVVALHGETEFLLNVVDSNATIKANISQEIITEIGLANLQVIMLLTDGNTTQEKIMTLVSDANTTYGITTVSGMQFGTYNFQLTFNDLRDTSVPVGSCLASDVVLSTVGSIVNCGITLQRRSVLGGNLLSTVGINVFNTNNEPVAGASVYANNVLIGLTNSGAFGTSGYLKIYQIAGNVVFKADDATNYGEVNTTLAPLDVRNFDIVLGTPTVPTVNRAASYASGKPWKYDFNATGDALNWVDTNATLPGVLGYSQTAVIGDFIYLFGGTNNSVSTNVIYKAPITDPTAWVDTNATLPTTLYASQTAVIGDYIYLFGGGTGSGFTNVIYKAPITDPTAWVDTNATLPTAIGYSQTTVIGDYIYLFGGYTGSVFTNTIYRAPITDPTAWVDTNVTLPTALADSQAVVIGDYVYLFGGYNGSVYTNAIYKAPITNPTAWVNIGATLPVTLFLSQITVIGDYVYLLAGANSSGIYTNVIYRAPITNPTAWVDTNATLPSVLYASQTTIIGDYIYLFGGYNSTSNNTIYKAYIK